MAQVEYADAIKTVSGALTKINKKSPHAADQKMVLATHRKAASQSGCCSRLYFRGLSAVSRETPLSAKEQTVRTRFTEVAAMVKARQGDLSKISADQEAFEAQRYSSTGKRTMKAYLWAVCGAEYDNAHA